MGPGNRADADLGARWKALFVSPAAKGVMPATKNRETTQRPPCGRRSASFTIHRKERQKNAGQVGS